MFCGWRALPYIRKKRIETFLHKIQSYTIFVDNSFQKNIKLQKYKKITDFGYL